MLYYTSCLRQRVHEPALPFSPHYRSHEFVSLLSVPKQIKILNLAATWRDSQYSPMKMLALSHTILSINCLLLASLCGKNAVILNMGNFQTEV
jgi:hypothetical protein